METKTFKTLLSKAVKAITNAKGLVQECLVSSIDLNRISNNDWSLIILCYETFTSQNSINLHAVKAWYGQIGIDVGKNTKGKVFAKRTDDFDSEVIETLLESLPKWYELGEKENNPDLKLPSIKLDTLARDIARMKVLGDDVPSYEFIAKRLSELVNEKAEKAEKWASENEKDIAKAMEKRTAVELGSTEKTTKEIAKKIEETEIKSQGRKVVVATSKAKAA